ncbi:MAG: hypothetical protein JSV44_05250 [Candidatus Zixiibacteriota bacterium]|nr:MAG: hypothetical protein JSV44_05250 [candidate division Zixibacteria bacterium]
MHWNDNNGDMDSELAPGEGSIDWAAFAGQVAGMKKSLRIVLEVGPVGDVKKSPAYLQERVLIRNN